MLIAISFCRYYKFMWIYSTSLLYNPWLTFNPKYFWVSWRSWVSTNCLQQVQPIHSSSFHLQWISVSAYNIIYHDMNCKLYWKYVQCTLTRSSPSRSTGRGVEMRREREPSAVLCCTLIIVLAVSKGTLSAGQWGWSRATARKNADRALHTAAAAGISQFKGQGS